MTKRNPKKGNTPNRSRNDKPGTGKQKTVHSTNDPAWYASDPSILRDAASIPFSWAIGTPINKGGEGAIKDTLVESIPGIMRIDLTPTMGLSVTADSALNIAATSMYSFIRSANSGHANYFAPDLMIYCGAMAQVYSYINWCQRLYGLATMYAQKNRYIPKALLTSMDVNPDSITNNLANFRYWINVMVNKASSFAVPATMSYFSRMAFLYSNIYCEGESIKDQLYYFHPAAWYKFKFDSSTTAGTLESVSLTAAASDGLLTLSEIMQFGEELLGVLIMDEDMNIMSGDILKAYTTNGIVQLASIPEYLPIIPVHDDMVLEQIHNCDIMNNATDFDVVQDPDGGFLMCTPNVPASNDIAIYQLTSNKILSTSKVDPGPEDVIESTRLMVSGDSSRSTDALWYINCGTEIPTKAYVYNLNQDGTMDRVRVMTATSEINDNIVPAALANYAKPRYFKYCPRNEVFNKKAVVATFASIDNYAVLDTHTIAKLHDVALMNMLAVPSIAKVNNV